MNNQETLTNVKKQLEDIKTRRIQVATKLKSLESEKEELLRECELLNVDPQNIQETINTFEEQINKDLAELKQSLENFYVGRS